MRKLFSLNIGKTIITNLMVGSTPSQIIAEVRGGDADGADAIALELQNLSPEYRTKEVFENIINSVQLPFMFILYRSDKWLGADDEKRQEVLLTAAEAGAGMIDVIGDLYDPSKDECTHSAIAIQKQKDLISRIHDMGAQVIMSSHPIRPMAKDEVVSQLKSFEDRGADVVKLVASANTDEEFSESVKTLMCLNHEIKTPFVYLCCGRFATIQRFLGIQFGGAITFGVHDYHEYSGYSQPTITAFKNVQNSIRWHY